MVQQIEFKKNETSKSTFFHYMNYAWKILWYCHTKITMNNPRGLYF